MTPTPARANDLSIDVDQANTRVQNDRSSLSSFLPCPCNTLAYRACCVLAEQGALPSSPLYIQGPSGMGKTHLIAGVHRELVRRFGPDRVVATNGPDFAARFAASLYRGRMKEFRRSFRDLDALLLDDVHLLAGKESTQQELLYTLDALRDSGRTVVVSATCPPGAISRMSEGLVQRFQAGLVVELQPLDGPSRLSLMSNALGNSRHVLSRGVPEFLSRNLRGSVAELLAVVRRLSVSASLAGQPLELGQARDELLEVLCADRAVTLDCITQLVASSFVVEVDQLRLAAGATSLGRGRWPCTWRGVDQSFPARDRQLPAA